MTFGRRCRLLAGPLTAALAVAALAYPAGAGAVDHRMMIKELYAGTAEAATSDFIELQMWSANQNLVGGNLVHVYDDTGLLQSTHTFGGDVAGNANQSSLLVGRQSAVDFFGPAADLLDATVTVPFGAGKACYEDTDQGTAGIIDCVSWGGYTGDPDGEDGVAGTADDTGTPAAAPGIPSGSALERDVTGGTSATLLDPGDDTNDSAADFDLLPTASPRNNAGAVTSTAGAAAVAGGVLGFDAAPGVANRVRAVRAGPGQVAISDRAAPIVAGAGCVQLRVNEVDCAVGAGSIELRLGDMRDSAVAPNGYDTEVEAGAGNDRVTTRTGDDTLLGGTGKDILTPGEGTDVVDGEGGVDTASYADRGAGDPVEVDLDGNADDGNADDGPVGARDNILPTVERLIGGAGGDTLIGNDDKNKITGGLGADSLEGAVGNDTLISGLAANGDPDGSADSILCGRSSKDHVYANVAEGDTFPVAGPDRCELVN